MVIMIQTHQESGEREANVALYCPKVSTSCHYIHQSNSYCHYSHIQIVLISSGYYPLIIMALYIIISNNQTTSCGDDD